MSRVRPDSYILFVVIVILAVFLLPSGAGPSNDLAQPAPEPKVRLIHSLQGPDLFRSYCAPCHGRDGKGNGPVAPALNSKTPDLTMISKERGGVFPEKWVGEVIAGDQFMVAHGTREMPIWGKIFHQIENDHDYGYIRLRNVTFFLRSIQQK